MNAVFPMCRFGADYAKATRMSGTLPGLQKLDCLCRCALPHERVNGMAVFETDGVRNTVWKTNLAGKYTPALCRSLGTLLADVAPVGAWRPKGEAEVLPGWARSLGAATGHPEAEERQLAKLPTRWVSEWHDAVKIIMDKGSWARRQEALRCRAQEHRANAAARRPPEEEEACWCCCGCCHWARPNK